MAPSPQDPKTTKSARLFIWFKSTRSSGVAPGSSPASAQEAPPTDLTSWPQPFSQPSANLLIALSPFLSVWRSYSWEPWCSSALNDHVDELSFLGHDHLRRRHVSVTHHPTLGGGLSPLRAKVMRAAPSLSLVLWLNHLVFLSMMIIAHIGWFMSPTPPSPLFKYSWCLFFTISNI